jgi:sulfur-carrier protein adenylyltransferase/sulfurtransferase
MLSSAEYTYYSRQLMLPEFSAGVQIKLKNSRVLVVGAGGLGCPALLYLAGAGVGHITIVDGDEVQISNLHRQVLYSFEDIGLKKADVAARRLSGLNPYIQAHSVSHRIRIENAAGLISNADVVIDATDNFETRFMLGDITAQKQIPLVFAAILGFEGQLTVFNYEQGPGIRDVFPAIPDQASVPDCATNGVMGYVPGIMGTLQASQAIQIITGVGSVMSGKLMMLDLLTLDKKEFIIKKRTDERPVDKNNSFDNNGYNSIMIDEISALELKQRMDKNPDFLLLDVREPFEFEQYNIGGMHIPLGKLPQNLNTIPMDKDIVVVCKSGVRSMRAAQFIHENSEDVKIFNLKGGLLEWMRL